MSIGEQVKELRIAAVYKEHFLRELLENAADTIESLSAKLQAANEEQSRNKILKEIREKAQELSNQHWGDDERHLIGKGIQCMCVQVENIINANMGRQADNCDGWIPCKERLPEEKINPITKDFCEYQVTFKSEDATDIRHYKFGRGHWWNGPGIMDEYVIAWREQLEPYHEP